MASYIPDAALLNSFFLLLFLSLMMELFFESLLPASTASSSYILTVFLGAGDGD